MTDLETKLEIAAEAEAEADTAAAAATVAAASQVAVAAAEAAAALAKTESASATQAAAQTITEKESELGWLRENQQQLTAGIQNLAQQQEAHQTQLLATVETLAAIQSSMMALSTPQILTPAPEPEINLESPAAVDAAVDAHQEAASRETEAAAALAGQASHREQSKDKKQRRWI